MIYVYPVLLAEGRLPVVPQVEQDAVPAGSSVNRTFGGLGPEPTGTKTRVRGASLKRPPCKYDGHGGTQARTRSRPKITAVERREAHFPDRKGRWRARKRAGVVDAATPGPPDAGPRVSRRSASPHIPGAPRRGNEHGCLYGE